MKRTFFQKVNRGLLLLLALVLLAAGVMIYKRTELNNRVGYLEKNVSEILKGYPEYEGAEFDFFDASYSEYNRIVIAAYGFSPENEGRHSYDVFCYFHFEKKAGKWELLYAGDNYSGNTSGIAAEEIIW